MNVRLENVAPQRGFRSVQVLLFAVISLAVSACGAGKYNPSASIFEPAHIQNGKVIISGALIKLPVLSREGRYATAGLRFVLANEDAAHPLKLVGIRAVNGTGTVDISSARQIGLPHDGGNGLIIGRGQAMLTSPPGVAQKDFITALRNRDSSSTNSESTYQQVNVIAPVYKDLAKNLYVGANITLEFVLESPDSYGHWSRFTVRTPAGVGIPENVLNNYDDKQLIFGDKRAQ